MLHMRETHLALSSSPPAADAGRRLSRRRQLLFILTILLVLVVVQEMACRWLFPLPEVVGFNRISYSPLQVFHTQLFETRQKGLSNVILRWECEPDGFAFDHTLNLYGFRGPNFTLAPDPSRRRILFVGDSYVEGCGVADADTLPEQFAHRLDSEHPVEAVNLGVLATGFPEYVALVRDSVPLLRPHTVFLVVCWNDLPAPPLPKDPLAGAPPMVPLGRWVPRAVQVGSLLWDGVAVPRRWPSGPYPYFEPVPSRANPLSKGDPPRAIDPAILRAMRQGKANPWLWTTADMNRNVLRSDFPNNGGVAEQLALLASYCRRHDAQLVVVYIPYHVATNDSYAEAQEKVLGAPPGQLLELARQVCERQRKHLADVTQSLQIPFLDSTAAFRHAEKTEGRMSWAIDGHCNQAGYRLLADLCARYWTDHTLPQTSDEEP
jgi:hypothetical protein